LRVQGLQRLSDSKIIEKAAAARRIRTSPSIIMFRLRNETPPFVNPRLQVIADRGADLEKGALIIVEEAPDRTRQLPIET
jgi:hypothetical protein